MGKIKNIAQVSEIVALSPVKVKLTSGATIHVDDIDWPDFLPMWGTVGGAVQNFFEHRQAQTDATRTHLAHMMQVKEAENPKDIAYDDVYDAQNRSEIAFRNLASKVIEAPGMATALIKASTGHCPEEEGWKLKDVITVTLLCFDRNFAQIQEFGRFFSQFSLGSQNESPDEAEKSPTTQA